MGGPRIPMHQGPGYVRVVGRHLFPHVYHKVDKTKLFSVSRRASRALAMVCLPSNYPYQMYGVVAGGQQRWQAGVHPPTYNSMRVADQTAASVLRMVTGWHTLPFAQFSTSCLRVGVCRSGSCGGYQPVSTRVSQTVVTHQ